MSVALPPRKRDRMRDFFRKSSNPSNPTPQSSSSLPTQATPNATLLSSQAQKSQQPGRTLLDKALLALPPKERAMIETNQLSGSRDVRTALEDAYYAAVGQKKVCEDKRWEWQFRGRTVVLRDEVDKVLVWLDRFKSIGDVVANVDPVHAGLPWAGIRVLLEMAVSESRQMAALLTGMNLVLYMANRLHVYVVYLQRLPTTLATNNFENALIRMYTLELRFLATAIDTYQKGSAMRMWQALWQTSVLEEFESKCSVLGSRAEIEASNCDREVMMQRWEDAKQWKQDLEHALQRLDHIQGISSSLTNLHVKVDLTKLTAAKGAPYNSYLEGHSARCLEGTRTQLLDQIVDWTNDPNGKYVFWLCGMAGTGKSTVSRTLAHTLDKQQRLGASFFFKRGEGERGNASLFFPTIAKQLADVVPGYNALVAKALEIDSLLCERNLQEQFEKLLLQPLLDVAHSLTTSRSIVVVDALDECEQSSDIRMILTLLARLGTIPSLHLRVFVTSRPELPIDLGFRTMNGDLHQDIKLEVVQAATIEHDIRTYIQHRLNEIKEEDWLLQTYDPLPIDWPREQDIQALVDLAVPLFIAAFTICRYVSESNPQMRLRAILQQRGETVLTGLQKTYLPILNQIVLEQGEQVHDENETIAKFRELVGPIVLFADPLSISAISSLLDVSRRDVVERLKHLRSVLNIPTDENAPVRLLHLSFRDFLVNRQLKETTMFSIDESKTHSRIAKQCLRLLSKSDILRSDMCDVVEPGTRRIEISRQKVATSIAPEVAYACCYWAWHIVQGGERIRNDDQVHEFLRVHFLHWLEALSWLGRVSWVIGYISDLQAVVDVEQGKSVFEYLEDARRFVLRNRHVIDLAPLQAYSSALVFAPTESIIRRQFEQTIPRWLSLLPAVLSKWSLEIQKLEGHDNSVTAVAFSPDGKTIASGSQDKTVRLWNASTGEETQKLEGHDNWVTAVAFSPDGMIVASGSWDKTVRLWNASTGEETQKLEGHDDWVTAVAFSPNGKSIASGSDDKTVRLWNASTGEEIHCFGDAGYVDQLSFDDEGSSLTTNTGTIDVRPYVSVSQSISMLPSIRLALDDQWIRHEDRDVLWLPHEYRGTCSSAYLRTLVIGQASGAMSFLRFDVESQISE